MKRDFPAGHSLGGVSQSPQSLVLMSSFHLNILQLLDLLDSFAQSRGIKSPVVKSQVRAMLTVFRGSLRVNATARNVFDDLVNLGDWNHLLPFKLTSC